jgi:uroporphyrin-III C-methyltransferase/precorrin-2 dehydrogenase/sirohydrochlorin ferrochelatase
MRGFVSLVGAGPGDPELLTVKALRRLEEADLVLHDALVSRDVLSLCPRALVLDVGKRARRASTSQASIERLLVAAARRGKRVVRLKGGDPFVFGRGGEEAIALARAGVPFEIVPGITSAVAVPALSGIPLTHRGVASSFVVVSGHAEDAYRPVLSVLPPRSVTVVVLMGLARRAAIAELLIARGWSPNDPAATLTRVSTPDETIALDTLGYWRDTKHPAPEGPGILVAGDVVALRGSIAALHRTSFLHREKGVAV